MTHHLANTSVREAGSAFVPCRDLAAPDDILCEIHQRCVGGDNCVRFEGRAPQLPADRQRRHYAKVRVRVRRHASGNCRSGLGRASRQPTALPANG